MNRFEEVKRLARKVGPKTIAVVWPGDSATLESVCLAVSQGLARAIMVGCEAESRAVLGEHISSGLVSLEPASSPAEAAAAAVGLVREGRAQVLMKGLVNTDVLLKAVLNKEGGLLPQGNVLTHIAIADIPGYERLLCFTDAAVIPSPTHEQREKQVDYIVGVCRSLGVSSPKIALAHCSEKVDERHFPVTGSYRLLAADAQKGRWGDCVVDGPLDVKTACNRHALEAKGIDSPIAGEADAIIFPDIEAGNVFYKTITLFAGAQTAGLLMGTSAPVVVPSRGDSMETKLNSIAAACAL